MLPTVLLADDHRLFRQGLRALIETGNFATVVGEAGNGAEAVQLAEKLCPDVIIMDLTMPVMNGIEAIREIVARKENARILALSMETNRYFVVEALKAGASGYLLKDTAIEELREAIEVVCSGETFLPRNIATLVVKEYLQCIPEGTSNVYQSLTPREREILQLIADGKSIKEISWQLGTSNKTVETQRQAIMHKLNLFSIAELTKFAVRYGLTALKG